MTRKEALAELIAKVEAGDNIAFADVEICFIRQDTIEYPICVDYVIQAYRGSLDAAKALRQAVLPWPVPKRMHSDACLELLTILRALHAMEAT